MKNLVRKPYLFFWVSMSILILIGVLDKQILSISIHADYYVFSKSDFCFSVSVLFAIFGFGYWLMKIGKRTVSKWLTGIHLGLTFSGLFVFLLVSYVWYYEYHASQNLIFTLSVVSFIFAQLFYFLNIIIAIFRK